MTVRPPAVAGLFYPGDPTALGEMVDRLLAQVQHTPAIVDSIVAPHAGYPYSGPTAGHAFAALRGLAPGRVVIMGPSHHYRFNGLSIITDGAFATPLGEVPIDERLARELAKLEGNGPSEVHVPEHAIEVELPFLQAVAPGASMVPVLFGSGPSRWHADFGRAMAGLLEPDDVVVISTDWSHFLDNETAHEVDGESIDAMLSQDIDEFQQGAAAGDYQLCGASAAVAGMACALARGASDWRLFDYRTSGDVTGETSRVVGYAAMAFSVPVEAAA